MKTRWFEERRLSRAFPASTRARRRSVRPGLEMLEARVVLNASSLDPGFGFRGILDEPAAAVAVQGDTKIVAVGSNSSGPGLVVGRYSADGTVDMAFGTNGQTSISIGTYSSATAAHISVSPDGSIVVSSQLYYYPNDGVNPDTGAFLVARLTSAGKLDTTFGTGGEVFVTEPTSYNSFGAAAVQSDGKVVLATTQLATTTGQTQAHYEITVERLTTAGTLDTSFGTGGQLAYELPNDYDSGFKQYDIADIPRIVVGPTGLIDVANDLYLGNGGRKTPLVTQITSAGALDTTFGTGGTRTLASAGFYGITDMAIQPDGKIIVGGDALARLNADGSTDTSFVGLSSSLTGSAFVKQASPTPGDITSRVGPIQALALAADGTITYADNSVVGRLLPSGAIDRSYGLNGLIEYVIRTPGSTTTTNFKLVRGMAITAGDKALIAGSGFLAQLLPSTIRPVVNDYDGDGKSDVAAYLPNLGVYAYRPSAGGNDVLTSFGQTGAGATLPASGDYDGDGLTDIAAYLPNQGSLYDRPSSSGTDNRYFELATTSGAIAAPGDYSGNRVTEAAVYLPATGSFVIDQSGSSVTIQFGQAGVGNSIPAPGDYDGDGKTDLAVYLPKLGVLAYRSSLSGQDVLTAFGQVGAGASIPTPGDYDGDGKTDISVYLPSLGIYAYRSSLSGKDVLTSFGQVGAGNSIPTPGDYDGDGKTDLAVYIPSLAQFIDRPSSGGTDVVTVFGQTGTGATIPAASIPYAQTASSGGSTSAAPAAAAPAAAVYIPLIDPLINPNAARKKTGTA